MSAPNNSPSQNPRNPFPAWRLKNGVMNATDGELELSSDSCERWGWFCGGLIMIGVVAEVVIAVMNPAYGSFWERWGTVVADALVAFGVGGEIMFSRVGHARQKELTRRSDERFGEAEERAANAEQETARLKKEVAWRVLDKETIGRLVAELFKIRSYVTLVFISGDPEATRYCAQFNAVFLKARWQTEIVGRTFMGSPVGVFVTHGDKWNNAIQAEMDRLRSALTTAGIAVEPAGPGPEVEGTKFRMATRELRVVIGHRPAPEIE